MGWKHDELANDLASYLSSPKRMVWTDMQLGPSGSPRPDVYTIDKSYSRPRPTAFEIKVSKSDLRSDTTSGKWQTYLKFADSVTFAVPDGLCTKADIPNGCGLIVRKAEVWRYARKPIINPVSLPMNASMKLLIDGVSRTYSSPDPRPRQVSFWKDSEAVRKKFGEAVAQAARNLAAAQDRSANLKSENKERLQEARNEASRIEAQMKRDAEANLEEVLRTQKEIMEFLGLNHWSLHLANMRLTNIKKTVDADAKVDAANTRLQQARRQLNQSLTTIDSLLPENPS